MSASMSVSWNASFRRRHGVRRVTSAHLSQLIVTYLPSSRAPWVTVQSRERHISMTAAAAAVALTVQIALTPSPTARAWPVGRTSNDTCGTATHVTWVMCRPPPSPPRPPTSTSASRRLCRLRLALLLGEREINSREKLEAFSPNHAEKSRPHI